VVKSEKNRTQVENWVEGNLIKKERSGGESGTRGLLNEEREDPLGPKKAERKKKNAPRELRESVGNRVRAGALPG